MSRVETKERAPRRETQEGRRQNAPRVERTPGKVEGDERTINTALRNQEKQR